MYLGRVRGSVVLCKTLPSIIGKKLRVVEEIDAKDLNKKGDFFVSFDFVGAGEGQ